MAGLIDLVPTIPEKVPTQLICGEGKFKEKDFKEFLNSAKLHEGDGSSYTVVAIMGPQRSGKSTLLNHLFSTKFQCMNSEDGRSQCTRGVWIAKAPDMEPPTMVLDLEGADGVERGPDHTAFDRQITRFALAVADVLIINMRCHDIGQCGSRDLLKDIFEAMLYLFDSHAPSLKFVIRDKTKTPAQILESDLMKDVEEIWETVAKLQGREDTIFSDIFKVEITILSNYELAPLMFENEVVQLRQRFFDSISPTNRLNELIPFSSARNMWDMLKRCTMEQVKRLLKNYLATATELISGDGEFNEAGFKDFVNRAKLQEYAVVAIMGPQSSGKSTLMNHLFDTDFKEMNAVNGRSQTTRGVWIAKAKEMKPSTIVLDLEGTDGKERGEDNTTFERQSAAFALAVADVIIVNMWCHDVGRENAANRPLLKVLFEVMLHLFGSHMKTLLFVVRDYETETPFDTLEKDLKKDVEKIWESAIKPQGSEDTPLAQNFNLMVIALSHYKHMKDIFKKEVADLRSQFFHSISPPGMRSNAERTTSFKDAKKIWDIVKQDKNLDLPSQKIMIATVRCDEIANKKLRLFESDENWLALKEAAATTLVTHFNTRTSSILDKYLDEYDYESKHFKEDVRKAKREYLKSEALKVVRPTYVDTLDHERADALRSFETQLKAALHEGKGFAESVRTCQRSCECQFDEKCHDLYATFSSDLSTVRRQLLRDIEHQWDRVRADKLPQIVEQQQERLSSKFRSELKLFLTRGPIDNIWASIRELLKSESEASARALSSAVVQFELDGKAVEQMVEKLKQRAKKSMVTIFKEETTDVQLTLRNRFTTTLMRMDSDDEKGMNVAYFECAKLLLEMAVIRLDEGSDGVEADLVSALMGSHQISPDPFASKTWPKVPQSTTLITPLECRKNWDQFKQDMARTYAKARKEDQPKEVKGLPTWVKVGLWALGIVAFIALMRLLNLDVALVLFLKAKGFTAMITLPTIIMLVVSGLSTCKDTKIDFDINEFRKTNSDLLESTETSLKEIHKVYVS